MSTVRRVEKIWKEAMHVDARISGALESMRSRVLSHLLTTTPVKLTTMTITAMTNVKSVCRLALMMGAEMLDDCGKLSISNGTKKRKRGEEAPPRSFYNQVTLTWNGSKSIKVFDNGRIHVTGCTSILEFMDIVSGVCDLVESTLGDTMRQRLGGVRVENFDIHLINLNFAVAIELGLEQLREMFVSRGHVASLDADVYPGLNVKLRIPGVTRMPSVLLFKSGKVIMTGTKTVDELEAAFVVLTDMLNEYEKKIGCKVQGLLEEVCLESCPQWPMDVALPTT